jgi:hypothetical protein
VREPLEAPKRPIPEQNDPGAAALERDELDGTRVLTEARRVLLELNALESTPHGADY